MIQKFPNIPLSGLETLQGEVVKQQTGEWWICASVDRSRSEVQDQSRQTESWGGGAEGEWEAGRLCHRDEEGRRPSSASRRPTRGAAAANSTACMRDTTAASTCTQRLPGMIHHIGGGWKSRPVRNTEALRVSVCVFVCARARGSSSFCLFWKESLF